MCTVHSIFFNSIDYVFLYMSIRQDVFNLLPNLNVTELIKAFSGNTSENLIYACSLEVLSRLVMDIVNH